MSVVTERPKSGPPHYGGSYKPAKVPKISLESAMRDFQAMFPGLNPVDIESVLRANGGCVEPTVEQLVFMCEKVEADVIDLPADDDDDSLLPEYYEVLKQSPPPSYTPGVHCYADASTQTELCSRSSSTITTTTEGEDRRTPPCVNELDSINSGRGVVRGKDRTVRSTSSSTTDSSTTSRACRLRTEAATTPSATVVVVGEHRTPVVVSSNGDGKKSLVLRNEELMKQLRKKQQIIEQLERNSLNEQLKQNRHSDPIVPMLFPCQDGLAGGLMVPSPYHRVRRTQNLSIQRQQNSSPPPNATVGLQIGGTTILPPTFSRNQSTRKSAKKRLQNLTKRILRRSGGSDVPLVSPASSTNHLLLQDSDSI